MKLFVLVAAGLALAGCQTRGHGEVFMSDVEIEAKDHGVCTSLGAARGSQVYVDCRLRLRSDRNFSDSSRRASAAASGAALLAASQPQNISCSRSIVGGVDCRRW
jgi:hypothetical protein